MYTVRYTLHSKSLLLCSGKNLATALSRHGIEPGSLIPVESQILSTELQQLGRDIKCFTTFYTYLEIGTLHLPLLRQVNALIDIPKTYLLLIFLFILVGEPYLILTRCQCSGINLATALSRHGIEPGSLIPVESQILSTEPQQLGRDIKCFTIFYTYLEIGSLHLYDIPTCSYYINNYKQVVINWF